MAQEASNIYYLALQEMHWRSKEPQHHFVLQAYTGVGVGGEDFSSGVSTQILPSEPRVLLVAQEGTGLLPFYRP